MPQFAHREIDANGEKKHIICAVIRGTRSVVDAVTDIKSVRDRFLDAGKNCLESLKEYQGSLKDATKENTILFITGHSLGASAACVLSCLADEVAYKSATHTYAIAAPNYDTMKLESKDYQNIHMYTNLDDIVPKVPLYYKKVGVEKSYSYDTLSSDERAGFDRVYKYFRGKTYSEDGDINSTDLIGRLRDHMGFTYMSFMLSEKSDSEIDNYIVSYESPVGGDINQSLLGDVNGDGDISILDAIMIQKHIVNIITLEGDALAAADTDGSGDVSVLDAIRLQKYIVNIITEL